MLRALRVTKEPHKPVDSVLLDYDGRFKRRIALKGREGLAFLLDLPKVTQLKHGDYLELEDGRYVEVKAAVEPLLKISAQTPLDLMRIIWHIGNRHLPCTIRHDHVLIRKDHVIADMITQLGGCVETAMAPFEPEGGAYGSARLQPHEH